MDYCWFILGNGRKGYLERTIASWETNLTETPKYKIIFDDSGNKEYVDWLNKTYGNRFDIVSINSVAVGQRLALDFIFKFIKRLDVDYVLQVEEDWMLNRPISISEIAKVLDSNPNIIQMRIPRVVWYAPYHVLDINAGSILLHHINDPNSSASFKTNNKNSWYEWRGNFYFWSHNPNVFRKEILDEEYSLTTDDSHEMSFGKHLMSKYPNGSSGFWATNPYEAYITHIGIRDENLLKQMPTHVALTIPPQATNSVSNFLKSSTETVEYVKEKNRLKVGVVIPWREQPSRVQPFNALIKWYKENLPDAKIFLADREGESWNASGSRNDGVSAAKLDGCNVIVLSDADTFPQIGPLTEAIEAAQKDNKIHLPYTEYRVFTAQQTLEFFAGTPLEQFRTRRYLTACSGVNVFTPAAWDAVGGADEKFKGWGYEDTAVQYVHQVVHGTPYIAHSGVAFNLSHTDQSREDQNYHNNKALYEIYETKTTAQDVLDLVRSKDISNSNSVNISVCVKDYLPKTRAGAEITLHEILVELKRRGYRVTVFCNAPSESEVDGMPIRDIQDIQRYARRSDIILTQLDATPHAAALARQFRKPLVHIAHSHASVRLYNLSHRNVNLVISNSQWVKNSFSSLRNVSQSVVYPPLNIKNYEVDNSGADAITLINLIELKGGKLFWELARMMPERKFIAVEGGYGTQILDDLPNVVVMKNQKDIKEIFKKTRLILMPSSYESWGRVGLEAAASGIPTIATATEGLLESLGSSGTFLQARDVPSLVAAIRSLDNKDLYKQKSEAAKARAIEVSAMFNSQMDLVEQQLMALVNR